MSHFIQNSDKFYGILCSSGFSSINFPEETFQTITLINLIYGRKDGITTFLLEILFPENKTT